MLDLPQVDGVKFMPIALFPDYAVGDDGCVWSKRGRQAWRKMQPTIDAWGYAVVNLYVAKYRPTLMKVHRLVLEAFVGLAPEGMEACHFPNDDKTDNRLANLRWGTRVDNMQDKARIGTQLRGEQVPGAVLTEERVVEMRNDRADGMTIASLAEKYGLSPIATYDITIGKNWKHAGGPITAPRKKASPARHALVAGIALLAFIFNASSAEACNRCGRSPCRFVQQVAPVVAAPIVATPTNVYVVNNSYPQPLVAGGSTAVVSNGGLQSQLLPLFDPDRYLSARIELKKADALYAAQESAQLHGLVGQLAALQAPAVEKIAAGQAAIAAGQALSLALKATTSTAPQSSGYVLKPDGAGGMSVQALTEPQLAALTATVSTATVTTGVIPSTPGAAPTPLPQIPQAQPPTPGKFPLLQKFCGACHGTGVPAPKGGFFLGDDDNVARSMRERFFDVVDSIDTKKMPPAASPQPTDEERAGILNEIQSIIKTRRGAP